MERLPGQQQALGERLGPTGLDEFQVAALVGTVDLVAHQRMPGAGSMNADLMHAAGFRKGPDKGKLSAGAGLGGKAALDVEARGGRGAVRVGQLLKVMREGCRSPWRRIGVATVQ